MSILGKRKSSINDNGATEPARVLFERLFIQTQKLEKMAGDSPMPIDSQFGYHLGTLETDLQAVLSALKKKEEYLEDAERKVLLEQNKINSAKEGLARREQEIASAYSKQEKLEEELKLANLDLASHVSEIDDLKLQAEEREKEIRDAHSNLALKEEEIVRTRSELMSKSELVIATESDIKEKASLLDEANEVIMKQEFEIQQLRKAVKEREDELKASSSLREVEAEKLKAAEISLEKRTTEWLIAQDGLKKLAAEASKRNVEVNATAETFQRIKKLLTEVKSELILSQKALVSSRKKMEDHELLVHKQLLELEEEKKSLNSYMTNLKGAHVEVESERVKLRVAEARNKELESDLSLEKELISQLQADLDGQKSSLEKEILEKSILQEQFDQESAKLGQSQSCLQAKESELVEAGVKLQQLKSEHDSLKIILDERDSELFDAKKNLEDLYKEIIELKSLMSSREIQLLHTENMLKEKEEHVQTMQLELNDTKSRSSEAETVVERILELTKKLIISVDDDNYIGSSPKWEKKQSERTKEIEAVAAQKALALKEEELKRIHDILEEREREIKEIKDEMEVDADVIKRLYSSSPMERIGELQIEAAQLEAEAATAALYKLTEMSRELLYGKSSLSFDGVTNFEAENGWCLSEVGKEVSRLSNLAEQLVKEAGIVEDVD